MAGYRIPDLQTLVGASLAANDLVPIFDTSADGTRSIRVDELLEGAVDNLGLGTMAEQNANAIAVTGGTVAGAILDTSLVTTTSAITPRTLAARFADASLNIIDYGAVGNGSTDDLAAFLAAYADLPNTGGIIYLPWGGYTFRITDVLTLGDGTSSVQSAKQNVWIVGAAGPNGELTTNRFASRILYDGASSAPQIVKFAGPMTGGVCGVTLDCNFKSDGGVWAKHAFRSRFQDLYVTNYMGSAFKVGSYGPTHAQCTTNAAGNMWDNIYCGEPGDTSVIGFECGDTATAASGGTSRNKVSNFGFKVANNSASTGIQLSFCDIIQFDNGIVHSGVAAVSCAAKLLKVVAPTGSTTFPQSVIFRNVAIIGDASTNYDIDAGWTNNASALGDGGITFAPFLKADVESCTNIWPTHTRLYGHDEENNYFGGSTPPKFTSVAASTPGLKAVNKTDSASNLAATFESDRATPAANDLVYVDFKLSDSAGNQDTFARFLTFGTTVTSASEAAQLRMSLMTGGTLTAVLDFKPTAITPVTNDGVALGSATLSFSDLFGASGFVFNMANGDWVATHSTGILTVGTGDLRVTTAGTNSASVVTVGGTQTLTNKTLTDPAIGAATGTSLTTTGALTAFNATAVPAGGTAGAGILMSSTANLGVFFGSGAPTLSAAKGSFYMRTDGSGINDRMYINTNGSTTWTAVVTVA